MSAAGSPRLVVPAGLARTVEAAARAAFPEECCGLLVGRSGPGEWIVDRVVSSANIAPPPRTARFEIDPGLLLRTQREARAAGKSVIGLYHSHPLGVAAPSDEDCRRAWQPDQVWLILALGAEPKVDAAAWLRGPGAAARFTRMRLVPGHEAAA